MFDRAFAADPAQLLTVLARADAGRIRALAERLLPALGPVEVLASRTGLVMLPMRDTAQGTDFFLGEVLVADAQIRAAGVTGYVMITGRDLERAMAMAVLDAAHALGLPEVAALAAAEARVQAAEDEARLRAVEATRVEMETFC
ncbi:MAG: phosphonate C-P lyase system protein PhnG [Rhodobacterales bacterium]|nr:phosphonate C-P lyase system protein PhnG [Rhodobacterales bacterium]